MYCMSFAGEKQQQQQQQTSKTHESSNMVALFLEHVFWNGEVANTVHR